MKRSEQTEEVKLRLYKLTDQFTKKYMWRYYKQFTGEVDDLIMEYYVEFLTPKSREKGKEESLLDKFDPSITTLEYLVKIAVQRKLIDSSRQDSMSVVRIDSFVDEYGDCITDAFDLTTSQDEIVGHIEDVRVFTKAEIASLKARFEELTEEAKRKLVIQFKEAECALVPAYREMLQYVCGDFLVEEEAEEKIESVVLEIQGVGECEVQQITAKTACVYVPTIHQVVDFNRETGEARGKSFKGMSLTEKAVNWIKENIQIWHSGETRVQFELARQ